ncbi:TPA: hypothetical protein F6V56_13275 [Escherichia coli]|uniref:LysR substrate-binding domain-containing protein n=3 Tax=root TaxID=1 RepID=A0A5C9ALL6_ECOLX|nr:LysR substrate-binding domain-containing protein [Escherichia coli]EEZ5785484.1 hypothetical protein [Escherichia coli O107]EEU9235400.1 hypothetical protein [Escherichia coli]EFD0452139.1 hypothetical protein [Escherichia coli]EFH9338444.1 hypothetical protein [Escherichia coli]EHI6629168.1 hypothetical protein [Escherichia coli]
MNGLTATGVTVGICAGLWQLVSSHVGLSQGWELLGTIGFVAFCSFYAAGGGIDYTEIGAIRWAFAIAPDHPLAFVPEPIAESQLRLYPNIMVEDTAHTINKKVGWLLHGQESILVPDFNTKCQCQILGEGIGFLPDYMVREAMTQSLLVTRQIHNPRQDSRMLLATQHSATGQVTQWIKKQFAPNGILTGIYQDLLHREN